MRFPSGVDDLIDARLPFSFSNLADFRLRVDVDMVILFNSRIGKLYFLNGGGALNSCLLLRLRTKRCGQGDFLVL